MRYIQKLIKNGNSNQVTIPRPILYALGWRPGDVLVIELTEQRQVRVRVPAPTDFRAAAPPAPEDGAAAPEAACQS